MKFCIIHGSPRRGNTYRLTEMFKQELNTRGDNDYLEFFLPQDMPHFCLGCYNCFLKGEDKCPHAPYIQPILTAIKEADGLIFTSPVYVMGPTAQMKALLDHLGYLYIPHRPLEEMFSKVAMIISTTAGAGTGKVIKTIATNLRYWGVAKIYSCGFKLFAVNWSNIKPAKKERIKSVISKKAATFYHSAQNRAKIKGNIRRYSLFQFCKKLIASYDDDNLDKQYWVEKGWL